MKFKFIVATMALLAVFAFASTASAQTTGVMPVLYSASGQAVNTSGGTLAAGYYFLQPNATQPVYYYGNGTFYNQTTGLYGGNVINATGAAGTYIVPDSSGVGVPNTGAGGNALANWALLALSALVAGAGVVYLTSSARRELA